MNDKSIAHQMDAQARRFHPDDNGLVPWRDATPPDIAAGRPTGSLRSCQYCGSMHPADVAAAIRSGAIGHWADQKYGWPHKAYFDAIPNPHAGLLESYTAHSNPPQAEIDAGKWVQVPTGRFSKADGKPTFNWVEPGKPASSHTHGKFYTLHLQDATPDDRKTIEVHLGLAFEFEDRGVRWKRASDAYPDMFPLEPGTVYHHPV